MLEWSFLAGNFMIGVVTFFSPCGYPMLPAFIAYYLDTHTRAGARARPVANAARGVIGGAVAAAGALAFLGAIAALAILVGQPFRDRALLISLAGGLVVMVLGGLMLAGRDVSFTPRVTAGERKGFLGLFGFGALYAGVSAGCVAPLLLAVVFQALAAPTAVIGAAYFGAYALGFLILLVGVTVTVSIAGAPLLRRLNVILPYVKTVGGVVLILVGAYLVWYWYRIEFLLA